MIPVKAKLNGRTFKILINVGGRSGADKKANKRWGIIYICLFISALLLPPPIPNEQEAAVIFIACCAICYEGAGIISTSGISSPETIKVLINVAI